MIEKVLWIEDGALADLQDLLGPVYVDGRYDLTLALDATDGITQLFNNEFAAVIVDIRIPPGHDKEWKALHTDAGKSNAAARLGLEVLNTVLAPKNAQIKKGKIPTWITPEKFAVFTVESEDQVQEELQHLGLDRRYHQKTTATSPTVLLDIIADIKNSALASR
jgi:hypothetical protein